MKSSSLKFFLVSGLFLVCVLSGFSQRDFRPGCVINNQGDTLHGFLLYKAVNTSTTCIFKRELHEKQVSYTPADLLAFRFDDGKYFIRKEMPFEKGAKVVFVEFLFRGKANIYYLRDEADHYFIEKEEGQVIELTESEKIIMDHWGQKYVKPEQYTGKLKSVMSDCPEIFPEIDRASLNHASLIRLARDYHAKVCTTGPCIVFERPKKPVHLRFGVYGGFTMNRIQFGGRLTSVSYQGGVARYGNQLRSGFSPGELVGCRFEFENIFSSFEHAGILVDFVLQRFSEYHLTERGAYDMITYNGINYPMSNVSDFSHQTNIDVNINTLALKIPLQLSYTFLKGVVRPCVDLGIVNMFIISQNKEFILQRFADKFGKSIPSYHVGFIASAGARFMLKNNHYFFFDLGYEYTQTTNVWADWRFINNLFELKAGFAF